MVAGNTANAPPPKEMAKPSFNLVKPSAPVAGTGICIYGMPGVGKSSLIGTMPGRGLLIDVPQIEGGTIVLSDDDDRIDVARVTEWGQLDEIYDHLAHKSHPWKWVAIDSITAMAELAKRKTSKERPIGADPHLVTQQDWGKIGQLVQELIYRFRQIQIRKVIIAQERRREDASLGSIAGPDLTPAALAALTPSMNLIGRLYTKPLPGGGVERRLRVGSHSSYITKYRTTKSRSELMKPILINPNLTQIIAFTEGRGDPPEGVDDADEGNGITFID